MIVHPQESCPQLENERLNCKLGDVSDNSRITAEQSFMKLI
jgi:hypothetical protein